MQIPFNRLDNISANSERALHAAVMKVISSGIYLRGDATHQFEQEWAAYCGQRYCVGVANGTDAVHLMAMAANLQITIVPATTCWYTAEALHRADCTVIPSEIHDDGSMKLCSYGSVCTPLYGSYPSETETKHCRFFDCSQAHGWQPPANATCAWSFYPTKNLGAFGDCGAVTTNNKHIADAVRMLSGRDDVYRDKRQIVSRMDEIQAAILSTKLPHLQDFINTKKAIARQYEAELKNVDRVRLVFSPDKSNIYSMAIFAKQRDRLQYHLACNGVTSKVHYPVPLHKHDAPWVHDTPFLPTAEAWCDSVLSLPCYPSLTSIEVSYICDLINLFYES